MAHSSTEDLPEKQWRHAYARELGLMLGLYGLVLGLAEVGLNRTDGGVRYAIALLPALAFVGLPVVVSRMLQRVDEREREGMRRALVFAFFGTAIVTFTYGFLEQAGAPQLSMSLVWPVMGTLWLVGTVIESRRGR